MKSIRALHGWTTLALLLAACTPASPTPPSDVALDTSNDAALDHSIIDVPDDETASMDATSDVDGAETSVDASRDEWERPDRGDASIPSSDAGPCTAGWRRSLDPGFVASPVPYNAATLTTRGGVVEVLFSDGRLGSRVAGTVFDIAPFLQSERARYLSATLLVASVEGRTGFAALSIEGCPAYEWDDALVARPLGSLSPHRCVGVWQRGSARYALVIVPGSPARAEVRRWDGAISAGSSVDASIALPMGVDVVRWAGSTGVSPAAAFFELPPNGSNPRRVLQWTPGGLTGPIDLPIVGGSHFTANSDGTFVAITQLREAVVYRVSGTTFAEVSRVPIVQFAGQPADVAASTHELFIVSDKRMSVIDTRDGTVPGTVDLGVLPGDWVGSPIAVDNAHIFVFGQYFYGGGARVPIVTEIERCP